MIARLEGKLVRLDTESALVQVGAVTYEVLLPGYCVNALSGRVSSDITLCTMEYYEGTPIGGNLVPRIIGFLSDGEKEFFKKFTSVKGIGIKKALRSLTMPIANIASAIENNDDDIGAQVTFSEKAISISAVLQPLISLEYTVEI